jgi:hypothetical protein
MSFDQTINSVYQRDVASLYKVDWSDEVDADEELDALLEPASIDTGTIAPPEPQTPPITPAEIKTPETPKDPMAPQDTVGQKTPPAEGGNAGEAEVVKAMAGILEGGGGNMKLDKMVGELKNQGFEARISDTGSKGGSGFQRGTIEVIAKDGTKVAFKDEDGDSAIGMVDKQFRDKVKEYVPEKYDSLVQKSNAQKANAGEGDKSIKADGTSAVDSKSSAAKDGFTGGAQGAGGTAAPTEAAPTDAKAKAADPVAAIGERISADEPQTNAKGNAYKYQVNDANLKSCPKGKPACTGCGECIKSEILKAQKEGVGAAQEAPAGQAEAGKVEAPKEQAVPQAPSVEAPKASLAKADTPKQAEVKAEENVEDDEALLKAVQAHLDSIGFTDKTAEELQADGQLAQVASQLGVQTAKQS